MKMLSGEGLPVTAGETYSIAYWKEGDKILVEVYAKDRDNAKIISNAAVTVNA